MRRGVVCYSVGAMEGKEEWWVGTWLGVVVICWVFFFAFLSVRGVTEL